MKDDMKSYIVKDEKGKLLFSPAQMLSPEALSVIGNQTRQKILSLLSKEPMYPADIAKRLKMHEQKIYYHIKLLHKHSIIHVVEKQDIRGTTAKKFAPSQMNFSVSLSNDWSNIKKLLDEEHNRKLRDFLIPFIIDGDLNTHLVVGSPDAHGPFKARARDGHYAIDLALFLGNFSSVPEKFSVKLDVDVKIERCEKDNLILIGGPVTNTLMAEINDRLPIRFSDKKPWGLYSAFTRETYTDDSIGMITRTRNPFNPEKWLIVIAGIRNTGTKAAVIALSRNFDEVLKRFARQEEFGCVVQGFDLDGDGKIDSAEVLE